MIVISWGLVALVDVDYMVVEGFTMIMVYLKMLGSRAANIHSQLDTSN